MFARARRDEAAARATGDLRLALRALRESRALPSSRRSSRAPSVPVQPDVEGDPTWRAIEITRWGWRVRETAHELTLEASLVAGPVREFVQTTGAWSGTATGLLHQLAERVGEPISRKREWPKTSTVLGGHLRRLAPTLRMVGVEVLFHRETRHRTITLQPVNLEASVSSASRASSG